jgi:hypothetical protein
MPHDASTSGWKGDQLMSVMPRPCACSTCSTADEREMRGAAAAVAGCRYDGNEGMLAAVAPDMPRREAAEGRCTGCAAAGGCSCDSGRSKFQTSSFWFDVLATQCARAGCGFHWQSATSQRLECARKRGVSYGFSRSTMKRPLRAASTTSRFAAGQASESRAPGMALPTLGCRTHPD